MAAIATAAATLRTPRSLARGAMMVPTAVTIGIVLLHLPYPFRGDQAFTLAGTLAVDRGQTLYRDFWGIRQPGTIVALGDV